MKAELFLLMIINKEYKMIVLNSLFMIGTLSLT